jgi:3-methylfumaryl-CoA hydratase
MSTEKSAPASDIATEFARWIGRSMTVDEEVTLPAVRRMAAMLDLEPADFDHGSLVPPHWYSMFFTQNARRSQLGPDGHPRKGEFLPPVPLPRRMFVGRKVSFPGALRVGDRASKRSEIAAIEQKEGRSGTLVFVTVRHTITAAGLPAVIEQQEIVYRRAPTVEAKAAAPTPVPSDGSWAAHCLMDPVLLFRYSALTWNGHRIHYDADYARSEEGYPGCVMNGGLTLHLVIEETLKRAGGRRLTSLEANLVKPLFVGGTLVIGGRSIGEGGMVEAWAGDEQGALAARCTLQFEGAV